MNKKNTDLKTDFTAFAEVDNICFEKCFKTFYSEIKGSQETCFGKYFHFSDLKFSKF